MGYGDTENSASKARVSPENKRGRQNSLKLASSAKLMSEENSEIESNLEDLPVAQRASDKSENANSIENSIEVIKSEDADTSEIPETPKKRGRGRPRKGEGPPKPEVTPRKSGRMREIEQQEKLKRDEELHAIESKRQTRALRQQVEEEMEREKRRKFAEHNVMRIEQGLEPLFDETDLKSPKKRVVYGRKPPTPRKKPRLNAGNGKVGRPSKQDTVTKQVVSIFQMDDLELFPDRNGSPEAKSNGKQVSPSADSQDSVNIRNIEENSPVTSPMISGIRRPPPKTQSEADVSSPIKFTPFPVPKVDEDGNVADPNFIKTHLSDVAASFDPNARLTDEKAFFLEGSEGFFEQHSLRFRPSTNSLASKAPPLEYEEFIPITTLGRLLHNTEKQELKKHQVSLFHQWCFEMSQEFNLNIYGVGSKAHLIMEFIDSFLLDWYSEFVQDDGTLPGVMVVNGYNPSTRLKTVLRDIVSLVLTEEDKNRANLKTPKQLSEAFPFVISQLKKTVTYSKKNNIVKPKLILVIHNIDGEPFRNDRAQNFLSQLASLPSVWLIASTDTINVGLLWDLYRFKNFNFIWHEVTTYEPSGVEMSFKDVLSTGKSKKYVGSKGAKYVLASLTTNAKNLYKVLSKMQLKRLEETTASKSARVGLRATAKMGIELKAVYDKCVQEYIASNEINFKTMLGEFVEHKMCSLVKNTAGVDIVFIPFTSDEIEQLIEEEL